MRWAVKVAPGQNLPTCDVLKPTARAGAEPGGGSGRGAWHGPAAGGASDLGKHAVAQMPRNKRPIAFGMILEPLNQADRAFMKNILPGPVRLLYPLLIDRPWKKYASTLRTGT